MLAYIPQMETRSKVLGNIAQSSCTKRYANSNYTNSFKNKNKFNNIETYGSKLTLKQDDSFRLLFENVNGLPPDMGYYPSSLKYNRLRNLISRFQADAVCLAETQINPALTPCTFSIRDKIFKDKESITILSHNKQELLGMRQQGGVFTRIIGQAMYTTMSTGSDPTGLG